MGAAPIGGGLNYIYGPLRGPIKKTKSIDIMIFITDNDSLHLAFALILHLHLALGIVPILTDDPRRESDLFLIIDLALSLALGIVPILTDDPRRESDSPVAFVLEGPEVHRGPWSLVPAGTRDPFRNNI